jgi:predicted nucleic acid-binding protein
MLGAQHKLATADAIIYATARAHGADVLTRDRHSSIFQACKPAA